MSAPTPTAPNINPSALAPLLCTCAANTGINVMYGQDYYPEGHQGGLSILMHDERIASNGDVRLEASPGQWSPIPKPGKREVDAATQEIRVPLHYPDAERDRKGFNPIEYPDLTLLATLLRQKMGARTTSRRPRRPRSAGQDS